MSTPFLNGLKHELTNNTGKFWSLVDPLFHESEKDLPELLSKELELHHVSKHDKILDAACGLGFPAVELYHRGYTSIECTDASQTIIEETKRKFRDLHIQIPVNQLRWSELSDRYQNLKAILILGSSISYVTSFDDVDSPIDVQKAIDELSRSFRSVRQSLSKDGVFILGVSKTVELKQPVVIDWGSIQYHKVALHITWKIAPDVKNTLRIWDSIISDAAGNSIEIRKKGVLLSVELIKTLLTEVGFKKIEYKELSPNHYDVYFVCKS